MLYSIDWLVKLGLKVTKPHKLELASVTNKMSSTQPISIDAPSFIGKYP
jgi:hypothetical protein